MKSSKVRQITIFTREERSFPKSSGAGVRGWDPGHVQMVWKSPSGGPDRETKPRRRGHKESLRTGFK